MTVNELPKSLSSFLRSGMMSWQLIQPRVQKSRRTALPLRSLSLSGWSTLNHVSPVGKAGAGVVPAQDVGVPAGVPLAAAALPFLEFEHAVMAQMTTSKAVAYSA